MIVEASYPARVRHVPARSRIERTTHLRVRSPVTLTEADPDSFEPPPPGFDNEALRRHAGGIWERLWHDTRGSRPVGLDGFLSDLRGDTEPTGTLTQAMRGTPLMAHGRLQLVDALVDRPTVWRGATFDIEASRSVSLDGRAEALAAVQAHLDANWRVAGGVVYRRRSLVARCQVGLDVQVATSMADEGDRLHYEQVICATPSTLDAAIAFADLYRPGTKLGRSAVPWAEAGLRGLDGEEVRLVANSVPAMLGRQIEALLALDLPRRGGDLPFSAELHERLPADRDLMKEYEIQSLTGTCGLADPATVLERASDVARVVCALRAHRTTTAGRMPAAYAALGELYLPTLYGPDHVDEDAAGLGGLSP